MCTRLRDYPLRDFITQPATRLDDRTYRGRRRLLNLLGVLVFSEEEVSDELDGVGGALLGHGGQRLRKHVAQRILI